MMNFGEKLKEINDKHNKFLATKNTIDENWYNGIFDRYTNPVLTNEHVPIDWRFDLNEKTNPFLQERLAINAVFNAGAIEFDGKFTIVARVEGSDRKSFFAVAQSDNGIDNFKFWDYPILMPETEIPDTNLYDMRLTRHEDGYIYGLFCTERKDPSVSVNDTSSAVADCGIARTKDLVNWERLPDLKSNAQQRNVVLHPEFVNGKYALYTRPSDSFIEVGNAGGIGFALCDDMTNASVTEETIIDAKVYHTIKEVKNGQGPVPIKTKEGWLHIAHGVRNTAAGLRYVLYCFMTSLENPYEVIATPGGYFMAPINEERIGDVSNVVFCNGAINKGEDIYIYYASSDTRLHVATTTVEKLIDYCKNTPKDGLSSYESVKTRSELIKKNKELV